MWKTATVKSRNNQKHVKAMVKAQVQLEDKGRDGGGAHREGETERGESPVSYELDDAHQ